MSGCKSRTQSAARSSLATSWLQLIPSGYTLCLCHSSLPYARGLCDLRVVPSHPPLPAVPAAAQVRLVSDPRLLAIAQQYVGDDIALFASHYICKPPGDGQEVLYHQDGSYWPLEPMEVVTLWLCVPCLG
eukprot:COSAG01_NODE_2003_length_8671_cov_9.134858_6_plen_130_part_00